MKASVQVYVSKMVIEVAIRREDATEPVAAYFKKYGFQYSAEHGSYYAPYVPSLVPGINALFPNVCYNGLDAARNGLPENRSTTKDGTTPRPIPLPESPNNPNKTAKQPIPMKTTRATYLKRYRETESEKMPAALSQGHTFIKETTNQFKSWAVFDDPDLTDFLDTHFEKFDKFRKPGMAAKKEYGRSGVRTTEKNRATRTTKPRASRAVAAIERAMAMPLAEKKPKTTLSRKVAPRAAKAAKSLGIAALGTTKRRTVKTPAAVERAMAMPMAEKKPKTTLSRKVAPRAAKSAKSLAKTTRSTKSQRASNERSLIKVKDADTLKGLNLLRERDRLAKQIHQKSKTQQVREVPVYRVSISTSRKQAYNALKATMDGKVKNIKIKTRPSVARPKK